MIKESSKLFERGNVLLADLGVVTTKTGSLQMGKRPVILVSNDLNNKHSTMISIVPLTISKFKKVYLHMSKLINKTQILKRIVLFYVNK